MGKLMTLIKTFELHAVLRELRLFKGEAPYWRCLVWLLCLVSIIDRAAFKWLLISELFKAHK